MKLFSFLIAVTDGGYPVAIQFCQKTAKSQYINFTQNRFLYPKGWSDSFSFDTSVSVNV